MTIESEWDALTRKQRDFWFRPAPKRRLNAAEWGPIESVPVEMAGDLAGDAPLEESFALDDLEAGAALERELDREQTPSLPIILFSAASGVSGAVIALFVSFRWLQWGIELSAGLATLALLFSLGISGAVLSAATGSRAAPVNILFSCGVILLALFFMALCLLVGALVGTILVRL
jgi:hypothetical protein